MYLCRRLWSSSAVRSSLVASLAARGPAAALSAGAKRKLALASVKTFAQAPQPRLRFVAGSANLVPPDKKNPLGEDAYFVAPYDLGVADGVGSWVRYGVDPGVFSRELMRRSHKFSSEASGETATPKQILEMAFKNLLQDTENKLKGSSTACLVAIRDGNQFLSANLGDSGFIVLRELNNKRWKLVYKSEEMSHSFNCPFQLGSAGSDKPDHATERSIEVVEGDLVIMGTDGLFDNLHLDEIVDEVAKHIHLVRDGQGEFKTDERSYNSFAYAIAQAAQHASNNMTIVTPFTMAALKAGLRHIGGKVDDITVITAIVLPANREDSTIRSRL